MKSVVVIGSGMGGLSCGVVLAKNGYHVTVLEQGAQVGGCLQCFSRGGARFETGMHFIGSASEGQVLHWLLSYLEVADELKLSPLDAKGYDVISLNGRRYAFAQGREAFIDTLAQRFPNERKGLERLFDIIDEVARASSFQSLENTQTDDAVNTRYQLLSINEVIDSVISDPELRNVLAGNLPLYAAERDKTPFSTYAFIMNFYNQSAYRIVGGSERLAKALVRVINKYGGEVLTRKRATEIVCDEQKATAVRCSDGSTYEADLVISAIHPARTIELVSSPLLRPAYRKRIKALRNTVGGFAVYLKFKPEAEPYMNHNFYGYLQDTPWGCEDYSDKTWPKGYLYMHFCEEEHMQWAHSGVILSYMQMNDMEPWLNTTVGHRGEDYERFKYEHAERLLDAVEKEFPDIRQHIEAYYTSTPLTYRDYTGTEGGSMYGVAKDINAGPAARVHHRTKIPNLLLAGQNVNSHGILGTLVGTLVVTAPTNLPPRSITPAPSHKESEVVTFAHKSLNEKDSPFGERMVGASETLIIGGGLGGLFTGALLAKEGHRVTVLEKNAIVGGGLQTFTRRGVTFDTGMHILGGFSEGENVLRICRHLGIEQQIQVRHHDLDCMDQITYLAEGTTYRIPQGREPFTHYFQQMFPKEKEQMERYVDALYRLADEVDLFHLRPENHGLFMHSEQFMWPADAFIAHYIDDERLRDILAYMNPMYGGKAGHTPAYIHALINVLYINGSSRFVGSSQQLADALCRVIEEAGGQVVAHAPVVRLEVDDRLVTAVETVDGRRWTADNYISAIHPAALLRLTDSKLFTKAFRERIANAENTYSSFCAYIVFKPESFPYINHTCYYQEHHGLAWSFREYDPQTWPTGFMYMTPCEEQQGAWARKMIINGIMPYEPCSRWADTTTGHRGAEYEAWKLQHLEKMLVKMERLYPGFRQTIEAVYTSSPLTIRDYYNEPYGALYGIQKDCQNMAACQLPVVTKLHNLFMTGQNVNLHGCCGVPLTAINTAEAIVGQNKILKSLNK